MLEMASDASGTGGCGAWHGKEWFCIAWDHRTAGWSIAAKELIPIVLATATWGGTWGNHQVSM